MTMVRQVTASQSMVFQIGELSEFAWNLMLAITCMDETTYIFTTLAKDIRMAVSNAVQIQAIKDSGTTY